MRTKWPTSRCDSIPTAPTAGRERLLCGCTDMYGSASPPSPSSLSTKATSISLIIYSVFPCHQPYRSVCVFPCHQPYRSVCVFPCHQPYRSVCVFPCHQPYRSVCVFPCHQPYRSVCVFPCHQPNRSVCVFPSHQPYRSVCLFPCHRLWGLSVCSNATSC